jgi:hypothetical protein
MIARNRSARIHVVTDPQDMVVPLRSQHPFVESLRKAGRQVEEYFVDSSGYDLEIHHHTTPHAEVVMRDCIRGASHDEIAADLAEFVAKRLADKARAGTNAIVRTQDAPAPRVGALLNGTRYFGADYSNFWVRSAEPTLCQNACRSDAKCVAWTHVQPGVQGEQARCWLKDQVPLQQSQSTCCTSGVERPEHGTPKRD